MNIFNENTQVIENTISGQIVDAAIEVHRHLGGPGLLESVYELCLVCELQSRGILVQRQLILPILYKGVEVGAPLKIDLLVGGKVIVEVKATEKDCPIYKAQLLTYLRLSNLKLGLLINFGKDRVINGTCRVVNGL